MKTQLMTNKLFCATYSAFTEGGLRYLIFHSKPRVSRRNKELIPANGFAPAFRWVGRRVLINPSEFFRIIDEKNGVCAEVGPVPTGEPEAQHSMQAENTSGGKEGVIVNPFGTSRHLENALPQRGRKRDCKPAVNANDVASPQLGSVKTSHTHLSAQAK